MTKFALKVFLLAGVASGLLSCCSPGGEVPEPTPEIGSSYPTETAQSSTTAPAPGDVIQPGDLAYLGAFRLPESSGGSNWEYCGHGLTYDPGGDPSGPQDGFPGSLFGFGHDHHLQVWPHKRLTGVIPTMRERTGCSHFILLGNDNQYD